jgi:hypothetical protein
LRGSNADPSTAQNWYVEISRVDGADTAKPIHTTHIGFSGITCGLPGFGNNRNLLD